MQIEILWIFHNSVRSSIASHGSESSGLLYNIRVLYCMKGGSGSPKLVGIVVNETRQHLKSYLIEFPARKTPMKTHSATANRMETPWKVDKTASWSGCSRSFQKLHVWVIVSWFYASSDWRFRRSPILVFQILSWCGQTNNPPEFRYAEKLSPDLHEDQRPKLTTKLDIFWLLAENSPKLRSFGCFSLLLWFFYVEGLSCRCFFATGNMMFNTYYLVVSKSPFCIRGGCSKRGACAWCDSHSNPIALPKLPQTQYVHLNQIESNQPNPYFHQINQEFGDLINY